MEVGAAGGWPQDPAPRIASESTTCLQNRVFLLYCSFFFFSIKIVLLIRFNCLFIFEWSRANPLPMFGMFALIFDYLDFIGMIKSLLFVHIDKDMLFFFPFFFLA